jgi:hypothetical protein
MGHFVPMKKEGSMRHDELRDMGHGPLCAHEERGVDET